MNNTSREIICRMAKVKRHKRYARAAAQHDVEAERASTSRAAARKHHIVPKSYLQRWACDGRVAVHETSGRAYVTSIEKAALERDFYRAPRRSEDGVEVWPLTFELLLSKVESRAISAIDYVLANRLRVTTIKRIRPLTEFMAAAHVRGRQLRQDVEHGSTDMLTFVVAAEMEAALSRVDHGWSLPVSPAEVESVLSQLRAGELRVSLGDKASLGHAFQLFNDVEQQLRHRRWTWTLWRTETAFVTCDEPLVLLGGPGTDRKRFSGMDRAEVALFPLDPGNLLVLTTNPSAGWGDAGILTADETDEVNLELVSASERWWFSAPADETKRIPVPPIGTSVQIVSKSEPGTSPYLHQVVFNRWNCTTEPPRWPVERWW